MTFERDDTFVLGLAMAGAVSAGAYTAGVLDFLVEAMDLWERAKSNDEDVPRHTVVLSAISGTSAGGVCAPLMCAAMAAGGQPVMRYPKGLLDRATSEPLAIRNYLPSLYDAWVVKPMLAAAGDASSFLSVKDIKGAAAVQSLLNSQLLEEIGKAALMQPDGGSAKTYPYISEHLHLFAMVGNATGVPYQISFTGGAHGMRLHGDRIHTVIEGLGTSKMNSIWAQREAPHIKADVNKLFAPALDPQWQNVLDMAMASCAFPAALMSRKLKYVSSLWDKRIWPSEIGYSATGDPYPNVRPAWPRNRSPFTTWDYEFLNVDGGIANNEAFEYVHYAIKKDVMRPNPNDGVGVDRMVLMIDPFPEPEDLMAPAIKSSMLDSLRPMIGVLVNQARFKIQELLLAAKDDYFSRFLIAPWGPSDGPAQFGDRALASGGLGGFGGFIEEAFRAHDFQLGRRNCQKFLRDHLCVPAGRTVPQKQNKIIAKTWSPAQISGQKWKNSDTDQPGEFCQVIPLVGTCDTYAEPQPSWPQTNDERLRQIESQIATRLSVLGPKLLGELQVTGTLSFLLNLVVKLGKGRIAAAVTSKMRAALVGKKQLKETPRR